MAIPPIGAMWNRFSGMFVAEKFFALFWKYPGLRGFDPDVILRQEESEDASHL